jgi:hypothetical protein
MVLESIGKLVVHIMKDNGQMTNSMEKEKKLGQTNLGMKGNIIGE